jgi:hypothetical protein
MVSIDHWDYMGSSSKIWAFRRLFLHLCSYNLVGSVTKMAENFASLLFSIDIEKERNPASSLRTKEIRPHIIEDWTNIKHNLKV